MLRHEAAVYASEMLVFQVACVEQQRGVCIAHLQNRLAEVAASPAWCSGQQTATAVGGPAAKRQRTALSRASVLSTSSADELSTASLPGVLPYCLCLPSCQKSYVIVRRATSAEQHMLCFHAAGQLMHVSAAGDGQLRAASAYGRSSLLEGQLSSRAQALRSQPTTPELSTTSICQPASGANGAGADGAATNGWAQQRRRPRPRASPEAGGQPVHDSGSNAVGLAGSEPPTPASPAQCNRSVPFDGRGTAARDLLGSLVAPPTGGNGSSPNSLLADALHPAQNSLSLAGDALRHLGRGGGRLDARPDGAAPAADFGAPPIAVACPFGGKAPRSASMGSLRTAGGFGASGHGDGAGFGSDARYGSGDLSGELSGEGGFGAAAGFGGRDRGLRSMRVDLASTEPEPLPAMGCPPGVPREASCPPLHIPSLQMGGAAQHPSMQPPEGLHHSHSAQLLGMQPPFVRQGSLQDITALQQSGGFGAGSGPAAAGFGAPFSDVARTGFGSTSSLASAGFAPGPASGSRLVAASLVSDGGNDACWAFGSGELGGGHGFEGFLDGTLLTFGELLMPEASGWADAADRPESRGASPGHCGFTDDFGGTFCSDCWCVPNLLRQWKPTQCQTCILALYFCGKAAGTWTHSKTVGLCSGTQHMALSIWVFLASSQQQSASPVDWHSARFLHSAQGQGGGLPRLPALPGGAAVEQPRATDPRRLCRLSCAGCSVSAFGRWRSALQAEPTTPCAIGRKQCAAANNSRGIAATSAGSRMLSRCCQPWQCEAGIVH